MDQGYGLYPQYSRAERIADGVVHALGLIFGLAACVSLAVAAWPSRDILLHLALALYGLGLLTMLGWLTAQGFGTGTFGVRWQLG